MLSYLESGYCESQIDEEDMGEAIYECGGVWSDDNEGFACPGCGRQVSKLTSLLQHLQSGSCGKGISQGFKNMLKRSRKKLGVAQKPLYRGVII